MTGSRTTSRTSDSAVSPVPYIDCISISYPGCFFLVNRAQIAGSFYDGHGETLKTGKGAVRLIEVGNRTLPLVNFDSFVSRYFRVAIQDPPEMIILARGDSPHAPRLPRIKKKSSEEIIETGTIAVQLSGKTSLMRIPVKQLRLLPAGLFPALSRRGLLAIRFPNRIEGHGFIEYLIDIQTVIALNFSQPPIRQVLHENSDR